MTETHYLHNIENMESYAPETVGDKLGASAFPVKSFDISIPASSCIHSLPFSFLSLPSLLHEVVSANKNGRHRISAI